MQRGDSGSGHGVVTAASAGPDERDGDTVALRRALDEARQQQAATAELLQTISRSSFDLQAVLDRLTVTAARLCEADMGSIARGGDDALFHVTNFGYPADWVDYNKRIRMEPGRGSIVGRVLIEKRTVHVVDVLADCDYTFLEQQQKAGYRTFLAVPLMRDDNLIGVFTMGRRQVNAFTDAQLALLDTFASHAVIAIENARLVDELQARSRELAEALEQQTATTDVLKVISRSVFDLTAVLQALVEAAARLCHADKATITRQRGGAFYRAESYGFTPSFADYVRDVLVVPERGNVTGRALLEGRVIHIPDITADPEYTFEGQRFDSFRTVLGVPMMRDGAPIGVIAFARAQVRPFSEREIELVSTFADQAAIAIENVRLFESVESRTRELARSLEELRAAQDRLVQTEKLASLGQLTAGIAHEIKNPLNFVNNFSALSLELIDELAQALRAAPLDAAIRAEVDEIASMLRGNLEKVVQHGKRADSIVRNMLLHSRQGTGERRRTDVNALVEESLNLAYHGARAEKPGFNVTLRRSLDPAAGEAELFAQEIARVLLNLVANGFHAVGKRKAEEADSAYEPTLTASTRDLGDRVELRIRDNGTGIPPAIKDKIFNPFFTTKPAGEGTGLGLSLSHDIVVKQHGGTIEVDTEPGDFTEFKIVLPRVAATVPGGGGRA